MILQTLLDKINSYRREFHMLHNDSDKMCHTILGSCYPIDIVEGYLLLDNDIFDTYIYPFFVENYENLTKFIPFFCEEEKKDLLLLPQNLIKRNLINTYEIDDDYISELYNFTRVIRSYKHTCFFAFLKLIDITKDFSLKKENHNFGYHFHLLKKAKRSCTILTFDPCEKPNRKNDCDYKIFKHKLFYEPHAEGKNTIAPIDINTIKKRTRSILISSCKDVLLNNIEKIDFKHPGGRAKEVTL